METGVPGMVSARDVDSRSGCSGPREALTTDRDIAGDVAGSRRPASWSGATVHRADRRSAAAGVHYEVFLRDPE